MGFDLSNGPRPHGKPGEAPINLEPEISIGDELCEGGAAKPGPMPMRKTESTPDEIHGIATNLKRSGLSAEDVKESFQLRPLG